MGKWDQVKHEFIFLEAIQINLSLSHAFYFDDNLIVEIKQMQ